MNDDKLYDQLKQLIEQKRHGYATIIQNSHPELLAYINNNTPLLLSDEYSITTKIYWIINKMTNFPICPVCGNIYGQHLNVSINKPYTKCCSKRCMYQFNEIKQKRKQTCQRKYGGDNPLASLDVQHKRRQTCLTKYGVQNAAQSEIVKEKFKQTCLEKYGVENVFQSTEIKEKIANTNLERYGVENAFQSTEIKEKIKQTCLEKYGVEHACQSTEIKEKIANTNLERYGAENVFQAETIKSVIKKIKLKLLYKKLFNSSNIKPLFTYDEFCYDTPLPWLCLECGDPFNAPLDIYFFKNAGERARCPKCHAKHSGKSKYELEIGLFLTNMFQHIITHDRTILAPYELDIYIPEKNLAIEFDGLYWHSTPRKQQFYHLNKTLLCEEQDIHLIHIFENEWLYKQDIVKSRIKNLLGIYDITLGARKCQIKTVDSKISKTFLDENHIQGQSISKVNLGLFFNDDLVSLMTFSKPRFSKKYEWELVRFCNKLGYHIPGAAGKLLSYFEKSYSPKSLVSYADRRWTMNNNNSVYDKLKFTLDHISEPNYWYWKGNEFSSRIKYQKHKLATLLETFDPELSEIDNMLANGYNRVFDCGNLVYVKHNEIDTKSLA